MKHRLVGQRVRSLGTVWDWKKKEEVPPGTTGTIVAAGIDAQFGLVNVTFDVAEPTVGLPVTLGTHVELT